MTRRNRRGRWSLLPFSQNVRTVFIGTSVGLYLGIVVGLYYVYDRYDQESPLALPVVRRTAPEPRIQEDSRSWPVARKRAEFESGRGRARSRCGWMCRYCRF